MNDDRLFYYAYVVGRLKPGVTIEEARYGFEVAKAELTELELKLRSRSSIRRRRSRRRVPRTKARG